MAKSSKASGLTVKRTDQAFTCSWKIPAGGYGDGQEFQYATSYGGWKKINPTIGSGTTAKMIPLYRTDFYPTAGKKKTKSFTFRIRGNRAGNKSGNPGFSDWATKRFDISPPRAPKVTSTVNTYPKTTFGWSVVTKPDDAFYYTRVVYESILLKNSNTTDGSIAFSEKNVGERIAGNSNATSGNVPITEDGGQLADGASYTRWFRIKSQGPAGDSKWVYSKHVYALPNQPKITKTETKKNEDAQGYTVKIWYNSPKSASRPISKITVEYAYAVPEADMECPDQPGWQEGAVVLAKDTTGGAVFSTDSLLTSDQCLFVRVNATYDDRTTYGEPEAIDVGKLAKPTDLHTEPDPTYTMTVQAQNNSQIPDSYLVVKYITKKDPNGINIGIIPHGSTSVVVQCPEWGSESPRIGIFAAVGSYIAKTGSDGVTRYDINAKMESETVTAGGDVPAAPIISAYPVEPAGTIRVTWNWSWAESDNAEISWADHEDAWESTNQPQTYIVSKMRSSAWNISGLTTGQIWYVRVRLMKGDEQAATYGSYSTTAAVNLSSAPLVPILSLSEPVITATGQTTASWIYSTTDGTAQSFAELAEVTETTPGVYQYSTISQTQTAQHITLNAKELGWQTGTSHMIAVKVVSESGRESDGWSIPQTVTISDPPTCEITDTSLTTKTIITTDAEGHAVSIPVTALSELPLTVSVEGAGYDGITTLSIERAASYHVDRPDESDYEGFEGETIYTQTIQGEGTFSIELDDLLGYLDDGAEYRIIATVKDGIGQTATATALVLDDDTTVENNTFTVLWDHQPLAPTSTVLIDKSYMMAILIPAAPIGALNSDSCDIYRLSADKPELIYEGATFGTTYVDPYATIGTYGGYRFVTKTMTGDYITGNGTTGNFAWLDVEAPLESRFNIIDFGTGRALLEYDFTTASTWNKDFQTTRYLGGSIEGDWNKPVSRTGTISFKAVAGKDSDLIETMRRLAVYPGVCHVRTKEGSSYPANVDVQETYNSMNGVKTYDYSLTITRVDAQDRDAMTMAQWENLHEEI